MYGRADGMPSFQLTVAVRGKNGKACEEIVTLVWYLASIQYFVQVNVHMLATYP